MNHYIGAHLSSATGFYKMGRTALEIGANTFQFFAAIPGGPKPNRLIRRTWKNCGGCWLRAALGQWWPTPPIS